jgi:hypothetical protein
MRRLPPSFDASLSAFREMTAELAEGGATRARVLTRAEREVRRRNGLRRIAMPLAIALAILLFGAALTAAGGHWRAPAVTKLDDVPEGAPLEHRVAVRRPTRIVPMLRAVDPLTPADQRIGERLAYERAHRDHFFSDAPAAALSAWDAYLAAYPHGTFAPEARYNRALCLVRLARFAAAADALRPFATGRFGGYRRHESCLLLRWLSEQDAGISSEPACVAGM